MLTTLFPGDRITASLARSLPGSAASASVFYGQQLNFRCSFSSCSRQLAVSADVWTCQTAACSCIRGTMMCGDPSVLVDLTGALEHVHGPFALECPFGPDGNGTECTFVVEQLRGILPRGLKLTNCAHGECVASASAHQELVSAAAAAPPSSSATSPPPSSGGPSTIAIGIGGAIVGSAFIALTGMFAWAKSVQLQLAKLPVGNVGTPGVDVGFKGVGYTIGGPAAPLPGGAPATSVTPPAGGPAVSVVSGVTAPGAPLAAPGATVGLPTLIGVPAGAIPPVAPPVQPRARTDTDDTDVSDADGPENQDQTTSNRDRKSEKEKKNKKRRRRDDEGTPCRCCSLPKLRRKKNKKKPKVVLQGVDFQCLSGRVTAIMGPSGSGKSSLLDIVAGRSKEGSVAGTAALEGAEVRREDLRRLVSFVDQEDHFLPYMTVRECVAFSARCRLPEAFPAREREARVEAVLRTLGLEHVADTRVGGRGVRGVSGGERRRVSIACELVTGSGVLVLDEPTSGLDAHTAASLLRTLKDLALAEGKTVVLSIHQPSSESFKLIDDLVVLAKGRVIYSGEAKAAKSYFGALGHICPQDYNVADFLLDLAVEHGDAQAQEATVRCLAPTVHKKDRSETRYSVEGHAQLPVFGTSGIAPASGSNEQGSHGLRKPAGNRTSGLTRFGAVMSRSLRSLFRDPSLMAAHFLIAVFLGVLVGGLYFRSPSTIGGLQNKLGGIVFILALLAFSSLSALGIFAGERLLFVRERSASYYGPASFAGSKLVLDLVPLRILPALIVGSISYWMIGLVPAAGNFLRFLLVLVLFNCAAALICMVVAAGIENQGTANLLASIVMLFSLLFGGFLINLANIPAALSWIQYLSIFRYATEALAVNEAAGAQVSDNLGGIPISIPASTVLTKLFGFNVDAFWTDAVALMVWVAGLAGLFFVLVRWRLVERR
ncbi:hypothetical protein DFJ74DRAFT_683106 [Hyaloraphidium curvatum]|nr:hypothetical protein DFJ74DRAFT_683106 [Hyaloraphidium curvatum]